MTGRTGRAGVGTLYRPRRRPARERALADRLHRPAATYHVVPLGADVGLPGGPRPDVAVLHDAGASPSRASIRGELRGTGARTAALWGAVGRGRLGGLPRCGAATSAARGDIDPGDWPSAAERRAG